MDALDRHARKQLVLTRIALDRLELRDHLSQVQRAVQVPMLLRSVVGGGLVRSLLNALTSSPGSDRGWIPVALALLKRYRFAAALLGGAAPLLGGRSRWRRVVRLGVVSAAVWLGWRALGERGAELRRQRGGENESREA